MTAVHETVEAWVERFIRTDDLAHKLDPGPPPRRFADPPALLRIVRPGRPRALLPIARPPKTPRAGALVHPIKRAQLLHTFFHHELQAAELMGWALLAFPETPLAFRRGLLRILADEVRHARQYALHISELGYPVGSFGVRDWFWERVPAVETPAAFVALMGIGFEGANLDHTRRFANAFRAAGDEAGAALQERIGEEEIPHVRFAVRWFARFAGPLTFEGWRERLVAPLSPIVMRGRPIDREARRRAGLDDAFTEALDGFEASPSAPLR